MIVVTAQELGIEKLVDRYVENFRPDEDIEGIVQYIWDLEKEFNTSVGQTLPDVHISLGDDWLDATVNEMAPVEEVVAAIDFDLSEFDWLGWE